MPGKRQHYVPRFLLRRFSIDPADRRSRIFRLDKKSGRNERVNPTNEAVVGHYYRMVDEQGLAFHQADEALDRIESGAAGVIAKLQVLGQQITQEEIVQLMTFVITLKQRTPQGREALSEADKRVGELALEMMLSDRENFHRVNRRDDVTEGETEKLRLFALDELRSGRITGQSTPDREVALMFLNLQAATTRLCEGLGGVLLHIDEDERAVFVLSDHPVSHYDPTPKLRGAGTGFMSSPHSDTFVPLDPKFGLLLTQERPQTWSDAYVRADAVGVLNLRTYASAREAIYGPSQEAVTRVRRMSKSERKAMAAFAYRPPRIWLTEMGNDATPGPYVFRSRFKDRQITGAANISRRGIDEAHRHAWPPRPL